MGILANVWGIFTTIPFAGFVLVYLIVYAVKSDRRRALSWSINITNIFLIHAILVLHAHNWPEAWSAWWGILLLFAGLAGLLAFLQMRLRGSVSIRKIGFSTWRLSFLILSVAYVFLFSAGLWKTMQSV
ncbi:DUF3397 family protein [Brevibacillus massiliensis]|jgi:hypothetical protein|uniref:DUF3397 family protein n=1 Tax=Brevibacillus massiliensis TaxID=1118054 RepID=UPI00037AAD59|nr:DUF3397 family protein [Brevibacillus massiliensis]